MRTYEPTPYKVEDDILLYRNKKQKKKNTPPPLRQTSTLIIVLTTDAMALPNTGRTRTVRGVDLPYALEERRGPGGLRATVAAGGD